MADARIPIQGPSSVRAARVRAAVALLAAAGLAVVTGCGKEDVRDVRDALPPVNVDAAPDSYYLGALDAETNIAAEELNARYERFAGDVGLEQASAVIVAYYNNAGLTKCVAEQGLRKDWETAIQAVDEWHLFEGHEELAPPTVRRSALAQTNVQARALMKKRRTIPPEPLNTVISECSYKEGEFRPDLLEGYSEEGLGGLVRPAVPGELMARWAEEVAAVAEDLEVSSETLSDCLASRTRDEAFSRLVRAARMDDYIAVIDNEIKKVGDVPLRGGKGSAAWQTVVKTEESFELAAWECKKPYFAEGLKELDEAMDRFETRHADKIRSAMAANQKILDAATKLGWSPERPIGALSITEPPR